MKKKLISCIIACSIIGVASIPTTVAFADTPSNTSTTQSVAQPATSNATNSSETTKNTDGPVFHVSTNNLLVKVGSQLNLKEALNVTVSDPYSQNLQDQIKNYPSIDTSKPGKYNFTMKVTDSRGHSATDTVVINVIGAKNMVSLSTISPESLTQTVLQSLVEGNSEGLKLSYTNYNANEKTFTLVVSNGQQSLEFPVTMKQGALSPLLSNSQKTTVAQHSEPVAGQSATGSATTTATATPLNTKSATTNTAGTVSNTNSPVAGSATLTSDGAPVKTKLPKTGSFQTIAYTLSGIVVAVLAVLGILTLKKKKMSYTDGNF